MSHPFRITLPRILLAALVAVIAAGAAAERPASEAAPPERAAATAEEAEPRPPEAGLRARIDPETGRLLARDVEAADGRLVGSGAEIDHWLNTYSGDLLEVPLPDGGYMVDLEGRFQSSVVVRIDPESGETTAVDCHLGPPDGDDDER